MFGWPKVLDTTISLAWTAVRSSALAATPRRLRKAIRQVFIVAWTVMCPVMLLSCLSFCLSLFPCSSLFRPWPIRPRPAGSGTAAQYRASHRGGRQERYAGYLFVCFYHYAQLDCLVWTTSQMKDGSSLQSDFLPFLLPFLLGRQSGLRVGDCSPLAFISARSGLLRPPHDRPRASILPRCTRGFA